jgi:two-component system, chemotaxis family, CheB/CheR fusion protein
MTIRAGILRLAPRSAGAGLQRPIDDFSIALAEEQGNAAIGVVLSGTGSDGTY